MKLSERIKSFLNSGFFGYTKIGWPTAGLFKSAEIAAGKAGSRVQSSMLSFSGMAIFLLMLFLGAAHRMSSQNLPYTCDFDTPADQQGWTFYQEGVDGSSEWNMTGGGYSAPNALSHDYNVGASDGDVLIDWMVSPSLVSSGPFEVSLMIMQMGFSTPTDDNCEIYIVTGNPDPTSGSAVLLGNLSAPQPSTEWVAFSFVNASLIGEFRIAFRYKTIGAAWSTYAIDNIEITQQTGIAAFEGGNSRAEINIFPNPFVTSFCIEGLDKLDRPELHITDAMGNLILNIPFAAGIANTFNLEQLAPGYYTVMIYDKTGKRLKEKVCKI